MNFSDILSLFEWLITFLINETDKKQQISIQKGEKVCKLGEVRYLFRFISGQSKFSARNDFQVYRAAALSRIYSEYLALRYYWRYISTSNIEPNLKPVLENLAYMYGLSCLDKHLIFFYEGNFADGPNLINCIKENILKLCTMLKPQIVGIIDALAPPDFVVNSVLGKADGNVSLHVCLRSLIFSITYFFSYINIYKLNSFKIPVQCPDRTGGMRLLLKTHQILSADLNYNTKYCLFISNLYLYINIF